MGYYPCAKHNDQRHGNVYAYYVLFYKSECR